MSNESPLSVSFKAGTGFEVPMITVRGDNPDELAARIDGVKQSVLAGVVDLALVLQRTYDAASQLGGQDVHTEVTPTPAPSAWGQQPTQAPTSPAPSAPAPQAPAAPASGPFTLTDKWNNIYEYNLPDAPQTPRGPMVKATLEKRDHSGTYQKWLDPAHKKCPKWRTDRMPPVPEHELVEDKWVNNR